MKKVIVLLSLLLVCSYSFADIDVSSGLKKSAATSFMNEMLSTWLGYSINDVINVWGIPSGEKVIADRKFIVYDVRRTVNNPTMTTGDYNSTTTGNIYGMDNMAYGNAYTSGTFSGTTYGGGTQIRYCTKMFEIDKNKNIISYSWDGNECPISYFFGKKYVNPQNDTFEKRKIEKQMLKEKKKKQKENKL